jgi:hypothetical protein
MTQGRRRKRAIRERMAETGENYTVAARKLDEEAYEKAMDAHTEPHITLSASEPRERDE